MANLLFLSFVLSAAVGIYAITLNRNGIGWALISAFITPFLASMILLIIGKPKYITN